MLSYELTFGGTGGSAAALVGVLAACYSAIAAREHTRPKHQCASTNRIIIKLPMRSDGRRIQSTVQAGPTIYAFRFTRSTDSLW